MSAFSSRLGTNYVPTEDEIVAINTLLEAPSAQLRELDAKIAGLQKSMETLLHERDTVASFVDSHRELLAPIRRLPVEVLQEIFVACLPTMGHAAMIQGDAPLLLTRICSRWRDIALATPQLYARFHVDCMFPTQNDHYAETTNQIFAWRLETMKMWIARSQSFPLSISFNCNAPADPDATPIQEWAVYPFFSTLVASAAQWQQVVIRAPEYIFNLPDFVSLTPEDVPHLRRLLLEPVVYDSELVVRWNTAPFLSSPNLHSLQFEGASSASPIKLPVNWNTLTDLTILNPSWQHKFSLKTLLGFIIPSCPLLLRLMISMYAHASEEDAVAGGPSRSNLLEGPSLQNVTLFVHNAPVSPLHSLAFLALPKLHTLRILSAQQPSVGDHLTAFDIERFFTTSGELEGLFFDGDSLSKDKLMVLVHALPASVRKLGLRLKEIHTFTSRVSDRANDSDEDSEGDSDEQDDDDDSESHTAPTRQSFDDDVLQFFNDPESICPALEQFFLEDVQTVTTDAIVRFLTARPQTLKKARFKFFRPPSDSIDGLGHALLSQSAAPSTSCDVTLAYPLKPTYPSRAQDRIQQTWEGSFFEDEDQVYKERGGWSSS